MENSEYKLRLAKIKADKKIALKRLGTAKKRYSNVLKPIRPAPLLSKEQDMMQDLFGGRAENKVMFQNPNSQCVTELKGGLMPNNLGDEIEDGEQTSDSFGFGTNHSTGKLFGI